MNKNKLKKIFILCVIGIIILLLIAGCDFKEVVNKEEEITENFNTNVGEVHKFEKFNYNDLSISQKNYISNKYASNVKFTEEGVKVYNESVTSGILLKTITSTWPKSDIGNFIPKAEYGDLDRIEYNENWINIYINNADKSDAKDYLKKIKEYGFTENETKDDGDVMLEYKIYDEKGNFSRIRFMKNENTLEIYVKKID